MNELMIFNNPEFGDIRTVEVNGEPWFVLKDVCQSFGETNYRRVAGRLDEDEKGVSQIDTPGGMQSMTVVNEPGLYSALFLMQPEKARGVDDEYIAKRQVQLKKFKRWVTSEVLPSIRKHGLYAVDQLIENPDLAIQAFSALKEEREKRKALETELDRSKEWYSIKRVANLNGVSHKAFDWRKLKIESQRQGYGVKKIFDANYGTINVYHMNVWEKVYPLMEL